jgi:uncharacterized coiled-coil DUF342 family protein
MIDQTDKEAEYYRDMVVSQGNHIETLKSDMAELTESYYKLVKRVKQLTEERDNLKAQLGIQQYWESDEEA